MLDAGSLASDGTPGPGHRGRRLGWIAAAVLVAIPVSGLVRQGLGLSERPPLLTIAAMPPGTSWYVFAATLARLLETSLPDITDIEVIARGGGIGNPMLVQQGKATIALSQFATAVWAYDGHPLAVNGVKHPDIRALAGGLNSVWMVAMLREDYIRSTGNDTLEKALRSHRPPRIIMKPPGSTVPIVADMILGHFGVSREQINARGGDVIQVGVNQIPDMLRDGRADLYFETAIRGHPAVTEASTTVDVRFLGFPDDLLAALARQGLKPSDLPVWFRGQEGPTRSVDFGTVLIAHDGLPDDVAYLITKTICENLEVMVQAHKAWADFNPAAGAAPEAVGIPLHRGAARYYQEKGWL